MQTTSKLKMKKKATKTQEAKKILKKKFKVNTKIVFTEDGEVRSLKSNCILVGIEVSIFLYFNCSFYKVKNVLYICIKRHTSKKCMVFVIGLPFTKEFSFHLEFSSSEKKRSVEHWPLFMFVCVRYLYESCKWMYRSVSLFCLLSSISDGIKSLDFFLTEM